jgi:hypothetical protein
VSSRSYAALREATQGIWERGVEGWRTREERRAPKAHGIVCFVPLLLWPLYIVGRGVPLPLHQGTPGSAAMGWRRAAARVGVGPSRSPPTPNTLALAGWALGPWRPMPLSNMGNALGFNGLPSGRDPLRWVAHI